MVSPRRQNALIAALVTLAVAIGGGAGAAVWIHTHPEPAAPEVAYYDTPQGEADMIRQAKARIRSDMTRANHTLREFGPPRIDGLTVVLWVDFTTPKGYDFRFWYRVGFAAAGDSIVPFGEPKVALREDEV